MAIKKMTDLERFYSNTIKMPSGCWEYQRIHQRSGYGQIKVGSHTDGSRQMMRAHIFAYENLVGPVTKLVLHICNNRACVNPAHLTLGDGFDNMAWAALHGTLDRGRGANKLEGVLYNPRKRVFRTYSKYSKITGIPRQHLYQGKDFFEACCIRKTWENDHRATS